MTWTTLHDLCSSNTRSVPTKVAIIKRARTVSEEAIQGDDRGYTPLHLALVSSDPPVEVVQALLSANPNAAMEKDIHGDTPMHVALHPNACPKIIRTLLNACPNVASAKNKEGLMPIHAACRYCPHNEEIIGMLVEANPCALRSRTKMGDLIQKKKKASVTPFPSPSSSSSSLQQQTILPDKHDPHLVLDGTTSPTWKQSQIQSPAQIHFEERSHQLREGSYPLLMAIANGAPQSAVEILLKADPDVISFKDKFGRTCLHLAVSNGKTVVDVVDAKITTVEMVELLHSLDPNQVKTLDKPHGNLPLHSACLGGCSVDVAKLLIQSYLDAIHVKNKDGMRPFDVAMAFGKCREDVLYLLELSEEADDEV